MATRGFVTIATGNEKYYRLADNLLRSYRANSNADAPFAIICDRENELTKDFDQVIKVDEPSCSYMDKLLLYRYAPYDETIFIDADCLVFSDLSGLWEDFSDADDVSCYGCVHPLDSQTAWFTYDGCGKYQRTSSTSSTYTAEFTICARRSGADWSSKRPSNWRGSISSILSAILKIPQTSPSLPCPWRSMDAFPAIRK